jgi:hypothetical protein
MLLLPKAGVHVMTLEFAPSFSPDTLELMGRVCDEIYGLVETKEPGATDNPDVRSDIANRAIAAVRDGERDPQRLKDIALRKWDMSAV